MNLIIPEINALTVTTTTQAGIATTQAGIATTQAILAANQVILAQDQVSLAEQAALSAGSIVWISGTTYATGDLRYSPLDFQSYRRITAGAGTTDPSLDVTNWSKAFNPSLIRSARTADIMLGKYDNGKIIDITSGTFTQTFDSAATLKDGWFCYLQNSGTGDITIDPSGAELIDGLSGFVMYPGEVRLVQCDGVALRSVVLNAFCKTFTASGTFTKPPGYSQFGGFLWAGGGSGRRGAASSLRNGGGGGACTPILVLSTAVGSSESVVIGAGGLGATVDSTNGAAGGTSTFVGLSSFGGGEGDNLSTLASALSRGGSALYSSTTAAESPVIGGSSSTGAYYGGARGGADGSTKSGSTTYGGAGGQGISAANALNLQTTSIYGGAGGTTNAGGTLPVAGTAPGGGGGASINGTASGAGARGELRIWGII
jgi:hypothetical protein